MTDNKNIIKGDRFAPFKTVKEHEFYAIIRTASKKDEDKVSKDFLITHYGSRLEAKNELHARAKAEGAEVVYFGPFKNKCNK